MKVEGHMLVNHSYSHQPLAAFSERALEKEIDNCDAVIADAVHMPSYKTQFSDLLADGERRRSTMY